MTSKPKGMRKLKGWGKEVGKKEAKVLEIGQVKGAKERECGQRDNAAVKGQV